jgi:hypothetical protein
MDILRIGLTEVRLADPVPPSWSFWVRISSPRDMAQRVQSHQGGLQLADHRLFVTVCHG